VKFNGFGVRTSTLCKEGHDIASNKDLSQPSGADDGKVASIEKSNETAENHVNRSSEEGWTEQQEKRLDDVGVLGEVWCFLR
jgi:hypothetical protein